MATAPEMIAQDSEEEVDELSSALEATQETDDKGDEAGEAKTETETETKGEEGEAGKKEGETEVEAKTPEVDPRDAEIRDLRMILRENKKQMALLQSQVQRATKRATAALEEGDEALQDDFTPVEQLTSAIQQIGQERGAQLDLLAETMSETQKYSDIYDVCSPANFNDMFDAIGRGISQEKGIPLDQAVLQAEYTVWQQPNPYKYMYKLIKEHHPRYAEAEAAPAKSVVSKPGKEKKAAEAPASIAGMGGSDSGKGGWNAARIDALPESELDKVPTEIYNKYLMGALK